MFLDTYLFWFLFGLLIYLFIFDHRVHPLIKIIDLFYRLALFISVDFNSTKFNRKYEKFLPVAKPNTKGVKSEKIQVEHDGLSITLYVYKPLNLSEKDSVPCMIYYHGGGFVMLHPNFLIEDHPCREICKRTNCVVVSVDYSLAPESKWPKQIDESYAAFKWVLESGHEVLKNVNPEKIYLSGSSAGSNLATLVTFKARENNLVSAINALCVFYPWFCVHPLVESRKKNDWTYMLDSNFVDWAEKCTFGDMRDRAIKDPKVCPMLNDNFQDLPPVCIVSGSRDILKDEAVLFKKKLKNENIPVNCKVFQNATHESLGLKWLQSTVAQFDFIEDFLKANDLIEK
ncbi:ab hydrolase superfamily protein c4a8.06c [Anaeramoeba flamelloides]|uniref:Ab hydrolase superfamily protein c4a8.06c n=1 Tax=Anaeramoeba flamelloides TaxID=1746091 RepID=A0AAV7YC12_9EUKA|nr:ab hydrolase superfamily protein c4a8.06c [Anaeramoeba flamelloides]